MDEGTVAGADASARTRRVAALYWGGSVVLAAVAGLSTWQALSAGDETSSGVVSADAPAVVVAARTLDPGTQLGPDDLTTAPAPPSVPPEALFLNPEALLGTVVVERVLAGEALRAERLQEALAGGGLDRMIDPAARAVSVRFDRQSAVNGLVRPGMFVDVMVTLQPGDGATPQWATETILQAVRVLAVDDDVASSRTVVDRTFAMTREGAAYGDLHITLEVMPAEAEWIALATKRGDLYLSLRAEGSLGTLEPTPPLQTSALLGLAAPVQKAQERRIARVQEVAKQQEAFIEVIRGRQRAVQTVVDK